MNRVSVLVDARKESSGENHTEDMKFKEEILSLVLLYAIGLFFPTVCENLLKLQL